MLLLLLLLQLLLLQMLWRLLLMQFLLHRLECVRPDDWSDLMRYEHVGTIATAASGAGYFRFEAMR